MEEFIKNLETIRQELPDPFFMNGDIGKFYRSPAVEKMIGKGQYTIDDILDYLKKKPVPALVVPSVLLLAYFDPAKFYSDLSAILNNAEKDVIESFEHGFWHIKIEQDILAADLIQHVHKNPHILLLLQRPVVKKFKKDLQKFIDSKTMPLSLYAMYCYKYTLEKDDTLFLEKVSGWNELPAIADLAKNYLQLLHSQLSRD